MRILVPIRCCGVSSRGGRRWFYVFGGRWEAGYSPGSFGYTKLSGVGLLLHEIEKLFCSRATADLFLGSITPFYGCIPLHSKAIS